MVRSLLKNQIDKIKEHMNRPSFSDIVSESVPFFSDRGQYEEWRNDMLQNKQPWGMVPLAEVYNEEFGMHLPTTWDTPGAETFPMYTTPERAGLEGLFAENPELNYQNPSNKMFPWQPNYPAIYAADKYVNEKTRRADRIAFLNRHSEDPEKRRKKPFGEAINVWDSSDWFREQRETEGEGKNWGGVNFPGQGIALDVEGAALREPTQESFYNELFRDTVPHEFGHELERDLEMWQVLPHTQTSGINPGTTEYEPSHPNKIFLHDILYNMGPHYSKTNPKSGINTKTYPMAGPPGRDYRRTHKWGQDFAALPREQAMNYAALQNFSKRELNEEPHSYRSNQSWNMSSSKPGGSELQNRVTIPRPQSRQHYNTGGLVSLVV
tara:strand:+ start:44 stop:1183 length:1140 start_codon:yes stop_codon:yes gene_type:complete